MSATGKREGLGALGPAIARLRQIAAEAGDHLLLGDGPPNPDAKLLDLCSELLFNMRRSQALIKEARALLSPEALNGLTWAEHEALRSRQGVLFAERKPIDCKIRSLLSLAKKLHATTAAGIYAKALVVRSSQTGAAMLAMTLAEDLLANHTLRASLWGIEPEPAREE